MSYASEVLADSPVGYWRMNEASGQVVDSSGNGNDSDTIGGTPVYSQASPITSDPAAASILLDLASGEYFQTPDDASMYVGDVFTLEAWIKRSETSTGERTIVCRDGGGGSMGVYNNKLYLAQQGITIIASSTTTLDNTDWHHVVVGKNGTAAPFTNTDLALYIDGSDVTEDSSLWTSGTPGNGDQTMIGAEYSATPGTYFDGYVAEVAIYGTKLSAARVLAHYQAATAAGMFLPTRRRGR